MDPRDFRKVMGSFATGVAVATASLPDGRRVGLTINSFTSVSLDPPLVLFCLVRSSVAAPIFLQAAGFSINILTQEQEALSRAFAVPGQGGERWQAVEVTPGRSGGLLISPTLAQVDCQRHAVHEAGDHYIILGRVLGLQADMEQKPLLYWRSGYREIIYATVSLS